MTPLVRRIGAAMCVGLALATVLAVRQSDRSRRSTFVHPSSSVRLPRLVEVGGDSCTACKLLRPVLASLRKEYAGKLVVEQISAWDDPVAARRLRVKISPTLIFFDAAGREFYRREGLMEAADIVARFPELAPPRDAPAPGVLGKLVGAIAGIPAVAILAAALWGVLTILLSPCNLAAMPLIVGFISGQPDMTPRRAAGISSCFACGVMVSIALLGALTAALGRVAGDTASWGGWLVAAVLIASGLMLLDVIPVRTGMGRIPLRRKGAMAALLLGLVFGIALAPCAYAYLAPVLAAVAAASSRAPTYAIALVGAYALGYGGTVALVGASFERAERALAWTRASSGAVALRRICGLLAIAGGLHMVATLP